MDIQTSAQYELLAEDCLCKAELIDDSRAKEKWLKLAAAWQALANLKKPIDLTLE